MSISFSGLTSGLDTSSWVESLTALKRAKVDTLEEEKETVLLSQETLNSIKSFFTSFRTTIEKITDTKFNVASMDLFTQKLVNSSDTSKITATATNEAAENSYDIQVDQLASNTQAASGYSYVTTIIQTTTATLDSKLSTIGVKAGTIGVNVDGVNHNLTITENDTISSLITKFQNLGVSANYNEQSGIFSLNINASDITDTGNTGIVDALHLEDDNKGYKTNSSLQITKEETVYSAATEDTKLSELGVQNGTITIEAYGNNFDFAINNNTTLGDFITFLQGNGIDASLDSEGNLTISDIEIVSEGTTNIKDALGLNEGESVSSNKQVTGDLSYSVVETTTTVANEDTALKDLGITVNDGDTVIIENSAGQLSTITLTDTSTLGDLIQGMEGGGLSAELTPEGSLEISGGTITGGSLDIKDGLGLTESVTGKDTVSGILYTNTTTTIEATESTALSKYGITDSMSESDRSVVLYNRNQESVGTLVVTSTSTIGDLIEFVNNHGASAGLSDGRLSISNGYIENAALERSMGLSKNSTNSYALSSVIMTTTSVVATEDARLGDIISNLGTESSVSGGYSASFNGTAMGF